jgi:hypothetical protein
MLSANSDRAARRYRSLDDTYECLVEYNERKMPFESFSKRLNRRNLLNAVLTRRK